MLLPQQALAWEECVLDELENEATAATTKSYCPDGTTCCPSNGVASCVPVAHSSLPNSTQTGQCCYDQNVDASQATACPFGYECKLKDEENDAETLFSQANNGNEPLPTAYCAPTNQTQNLDPYAHDVPRYKTCRLSEDMLRLHGFPIVDEGNGRTFHLGYYSSLGSITRDEAAEKDTTINHEKVELAVIVIHGSLRDADDYFCAGLTLLDDNDSGDESLNQDNTLVIAPWFTSVSDDMNQASIVPNSNRSKKHSMLPKNLLVWEDVVNAYDSFYWHLWRYGANAHNAAISSFTALDRVVEHLVNAREAFPNLQQISVVGHSAGGQMAHRWALLASSPAWENSQVSIRAVAANPRSYLYLDDRRWIPPANDKEANEHSFRRPSQETLEECPEYNMYLWGLQSGGDLSCPYRDKALADVGGSTNALADRYASRDVIYLSGEYDVIPQDHDHCAALLQGRMRNERARNYFAGLQEYFGRSVHALHFVPFSGHDHALMFQSDVGQAAILGNRLSKTTAQRKQNLRKNASQTSRYIRPIDGKQ